MKKFVDYDNAQFYENSDHPMRDKLFNWVVERHSAAGKKRSWTSLYIWSTMRDGLPWSASDQFIWHGMIYVVWDWIGMLIFLYIIYFLANYAYDHYGLFKAVAFLAVTCLIRLNTLIRLQKQNNKLLGAK